MRLTDAQRELLHMLSLRMNGGVVRSKELKVALYELVHTGLVRNVYDMPSGGVFGVITDAGRAALKGGNDAT